MRLLKAMLDLFVVDARFTLALALWIAASAFVPLLTGGHNLIAAIVFTAGFIAILVENVLHAAAHRLASPAGSRARPATSPVKSRNGAAVTDTFGPRAVDRFSGIPASARR